MAEMNGTIKTVLTEKGFGFISATGYPASWTPYHTLEAARAAAAAVLREERVQRVAIVVGSGAFVEWLDR